MKQALPSLSFLLLGISEITVTWSKEMNFFDLIPALLLIHVNRTNERKFNFINFRSHTACSKKVTKLQSIVWSFF